VSRFIKSTSGVSPVRSHLAFDIGMFELLITELDALHSQAVVGLTVLGRALALAVNATARQLESAPQPMWRGQAPRRSLT